MILSVRVECALAIWLAVEGAICSVPRESGDRLVQPAQHSGEARIVCSTGADSSEGRGVLARGASNQQAYGEHCRKDHKHNPVALHKIYLTIDELII